MCPALCRGNSRLFCRNERPFCGNIGLCCDATALLSALFATTNIISTWWTGITAPKHYLHPQTLSEPTNLSSPTNIIITHKHYHHPQTLSSPTDIIITHKHYQNPQTLSSPTNIIRTHKHYHHPQTLSSPTNIIITHKHYNLHHYDQHHPRNMKWLQVGGVIDALSCRSFFAKEPLIIRLFCGKWHSQRGYPMGLGHPVAQHMNWL